VLKEAEDSKGKDDDNFDANAAILTGELSQLVPDLLEALGGEQAAPAIETAEAAA